MTAKVDFGRRRKPAQPVTAVGFTHDESRFGQIVFIGDALHQRVVKPAFARYDRRRIALERLFGKRINLPETKFHIVTPKKRISPIYPVYAAHRSAAATWRQCGTTRNSNARLSSPRKRGPSACNHLKLCPAVRSSNSCGGQVPASAEMPCCFENCLSSPWRAYGCAFRRARASSAVAASRRRAPRSAAPARD